MTPERCDGPAARHRSSLRTPAADSPRPHAHIDKTGRQEASFRSIDRSEREEGPMEGARGGDGGGGSSSIGRGQEQPEPPPDLSPPPPPPPAPPSQEQQDQQQRPSPPGPLLPPPQPPSSSSGTAEQQPPLCPICRESMAALGPGKGIVRTSRSPSLPLLLLLLPKPQPTLKINTPTFTHTHNKTDLPLPAPPLPPGVRPCLRRALLGGAPLPHPLPRPRLRRRHDGCAGACVRAWVLSGWSDLGFLLGVGRTHVKGRYTNAHTK